MDEELKAIANRLKNLKVLTGEHSTPVNFAFGVLYSLIQARRMGYPEESLQVSSKGRGLEMWNHVKQAATLFTQTGTLNPPQNWIAGYYFNGALIRLAANFEHIVRNKTGLHDRKESYESIRKAAAGKGFEARWLESWHLAHEELNRIRHRNVEFVDGPQMTFLEAVEALQHLIDALAWGLETSPT